MNQPIRIQMNLSIIFFVLSVNLRAAYASSHKQAAKLKNIQN